MSATCNRALWIVAFNAMRCSIAALREHRRAGRDRFPSDRVQNEQTVRSQIIGVDGATAARADSWEPMQLCAEIDADAGGDGWARKRRFDIFERTEYPGTGSFFERAVWEEKPYMIRHDRG